MAGHRVARWGRGERVVPGLVRKYVEFWDGVVLQDHPLRETLVSYLRDGVSVHEFLIASHRGPSVDLPYKADRFPGAVFSNRVPPMHADFVDAEMHSLIARGCVAAVCGGTWSAANTRDHPLRETLVSYLRDGVSVREFLIASHRGPSVDLPYKADRFPGAVFSNCVPPTHADFVDAEMHSLIARGCFAAVWGGIWSAPIHPLF